MSAAPSFHLPRRFIFNEVDLAHWLASPVRRAQRVLRLCALAARACAAARRYEHCAQRCGLLSRLPAPPARRHVPSTLPFCSL